MNGDSHWELLPPDADLAADWDRIVLASDDYAVFQSSGWGEYKRREGWMPMRWIARDASGNVLMAAQVLARTFLGRVRVAWCPGGPAFCFPHTDARALPDLLGALLREVSTTGPTYVRLDSYVPHSPELAYAFSRACTRPFARLNTGFSMAHDLRKPMEAILADMTAKHRYYVRRALAQDVAWDARSDAVAVRELARLHNDMVRRKALRSLPRLEPAEIEALCRAFGGGAIMFVGAVDGTAVTAALVLTFGTKAFFYAAATGDEGRKAGVGYASFHRLLAHLQARGIAHFDFGGLDPRADPGGVNHFKGGFGGTLVEYLGEWEWANHDWLRWAVNLYVLLRYPFPAEDDATPADAAPY